MADTIAVMHGGKIEQAGTATDLYEHPQTEFVANFLGISNLVDGTMRGADGDTSRVETHDGAKLHVLTRRCGVKEGDVRVGVRPEKVHLVPVGQEVRADANVLHGTVIVAAFLGVSIQYLIKAAGGEELTVFAQNVRRRGDRHARPGHRGPARVGHRAHVRRGAGDRGWLTRATSSARSRSCWPASA